MFRKIHGTKNETLTVYIDGLPVVAEKDESIAAVLLRQDSFWFRTTPILGKKRAPYCMMGVCFDCLAIVDGIGSVQTCLTTVREGMQIVRQLGRRDMML